MAMKVEIIRRETIRPSFPTPPDRKSLHLSLLDQFMPISYKTLIFFYHRNGATDDLHAKATEKSRLLKRSLSETLTQFYPFAGRLKENASVECHDDGAQFVEARIQCRLSNFLRKPDPVELKQLLPVPIESHEAVTGCLLQVQATFFECGGLAVGVCVSHKLADAATVATFVKYWAATARQASEVVGPLFLGPSIFPPMDVSIPRSSVQVKQEMCLTRRFVFDAANLTALKAKVGSESVRDPTRVEAVSALIWKCAINSSASKLGFTKPSAWCISANIRSRLAPAVPGNFAGNCVGYFAASIQENGEFELPDLVGRIRKEKERFGENYVKRLHGDGASLAICGFAEEFGKMAMSNEIEFYGCASWCRYELYEGAHFGWGEPAWLSLTSTPFKNFVFLMDTKDGEGIEAWLTLAEENMGLLESNQDLLRFAAVNPSVSL